MKLFAIFTVVFLFSLHYATTLYVNSSLLSNYFTNSQIGLLYILGAILNIFLFLKAPKIMKTLGSKRFLLGFLTLSLFGIIGLIFAKSALLAGSAMVLYIAVTTMVYYALDIFLEELSHEDETGGIRGSYLTVTNLAILFGPLTVSIFAQIGKLQYLYIFAALLLIPVFLITILSLNLTRKDEVGIKKTLDFQTLWGNKDLRTISTVRTMLEIFYAVMTIYIPIYLSQILGFSWSEIGVAFTIMLLPFVLFQWPVGLLADKEFGEKEFLIGGLIISLFSLVAMPFLGPSIASWTIVLFLSRVGASVIEVMTDSYFFKHVDERDAGIISLFRLTRPLGLIIGASLSAVVLIFFSYSALFYLLCFFMLKGVYDALKLVDTK